MAETAKILSPKKKVLLPDLSAGCSLADMITVKDLLKLKAKHPNARVVCYINSNAEIKAESDVCCTSSNAVKIVENLDSHEVIMVPDKYLAAYVADQLALKGIDKKIIPWNGFCAVHQRILPSYIKNLKKKNPRALIVTHPECACSVNVLSDSIKSTSGMSNYVRESGGNTFIIGTETGLLHKLKQEFPDKKFIPATALAECGFMKKITLKKLYDALKEMKYEIKVDIKIAAKAKRAIEKMLGS
jgi:quinolinate synthase